MYVYTYATLELSPSRIQPDSLQRNVPHSGVGICIVFLRVANESREETSVIMKRDFVLFLYVGFSDNEIDILVIQRYLGKILFRNILFLYETSHVFQDFIFHNEYF